MWARLPSVLHNCTVQEKWQARPDGTDLWSHSAVAPLLALYAGIIGLRALAPGYARFSLTPQLGSPADLEAELHTPQGALLFRSQREGAGQRVTLRTPPSGAGEICLPTAAALRVELPELPPCQAGWRRWPLTVGGACTILVSAAEPRGTAPQAGWRLSAG